MSWALCKLSAGRLKQSFVTACGIRMLHLKKHPNYTEDNSKPLKFSTSKGSHRHWTVEQSFGSDYQIPWWKALPVSFFIAAVMIWIFFRKETEIDKVLYRPISELLDEVENAEPENEKGK